MNATKCWNNWVSWNFNKSMFLFIAYKIKTNRLQLKWWQLTIGTYDPHELIIYRKTRLLNPSIHNAKLTLADSLMNNQSVFFYSHRYASRRSRNFPQYAAFKTSDDVLRYAQQRNSSGLPQIHARCNWRSLKTKKKNLPHKFRNKHKAN